MHTFVLMGQGGRLSSFGMISLHSRIPGSSSIHSWNDPRVLKLIKDYPGKIAVVGYSLGANQLGWISDHCGKEIELGVAYDPSRYSPLVKNGYQRAPKFKKLLCYYNEGAMFFGGSYYKGSNVELVKVNNFHLGIQFMEDLHKKTLEAIKEVE
jgi:hypothetical protein